MILCQRLLNKALNGCSNFASHFGYFYSFARTERCDRRRYHASTIGQLAPFAIGTSSLFHIGRTTEGSWLDATMTKQFSFIRLINCGNKKRDVKRCKKEHSHA